MDNMDNIKQFLAQIMLDNGSMVSKICTDNEIVTLTNNYDFNGISAMRVYDVSIYDKIVPLKYVGWQKNCLIQYVDDNNNIIISGYGEDH